MKTIEGYTYKINEHIGKGYSSTVHKGVNDKTGENVSIKVIEMAKLEDPINQMLLQHEITALKKLSFLLAFCTFTMSTLQKQHIYCDRTL